MLACVCTDKLTFSKQSGLIFSLAWFKPYWISFFYLFCLLLLTCSRHYIWFLSWMYLACNFQQITSSWTLKKKKKAHVLNKCSFFFPHVLFLFVLNECNCSTSHIVYFHNIVCQMCLMCECPGFIFVLNVLSTWRCPFIYTVPCECEDASVPVCLGMYWPSSLMGDCSLISLCFEYCLWT